MSSVQTVHGEAGLAHRENPVLSESQIVDHFYVRPLVGQDRSDLAFHATRWASLLTRVDALVRDAEARSPGRRLRLLDIGPSLQTDLLRHNLPGHLVDTVDLHETHKELRDGERHLVYDLNELYFRDRWPELGPFDGIVMCEVIEHLYTSAEIVFEALASFLVPGGFIFLQTPNAAALHKRLQLAAGRNPYMSLAESRMTPPHFHEYTVRELTAAAATAGLETVDVEMRNYFTRNTAFSRAYNAICERLPGSLRAGISLTLVKS